MKRRCQCGRPIDEPAADNPDEETPDEETTVRATSACARLIVYGFQPSWSHRHGVSRVSISLEDAERLVERMRRTGGVVPAGSELADALERIANALEHP